MTIMCKECKATRQLVCKPGKGGALVPRTCDNQAAATAGGQDPCGLDPYVVLPNRSQYVDQQELKMQVCSASWRVVSPGTTRSLPSNSRMQTCTPAEPSLTCRPVCKVDSHVGAHRSGQRTCPRESCRAPSSCW